jgi:hypothetical protein
MKAHPLRTVAAIVAFALVTGSVVVCIRLNWNKREARQLVLDAEKLEQDGTTAGLGDFLAKHGRFVRPAANCSESRCAYVGELKNSSLAFFRLSPPGEFYISILAEKGRVQEVYLSAKTAISGKPYAATMRGVSAEGLGGSVKALSSNAVVDASGRILTSTMELGPMATPAERRMAFQMDVNCIFELKGCSDPSQITGGWPRHAED